MVQREPFASFSGRDYRTDRASGLSGSVERRQDPLGAIREAQSPRSVWDDLIPERSAADWNSLARPLTEGRDDIFFPGKYDYGRIASQLASQGLSVSALTPGIGPLVIGGNFLSKRYLDIDLFNLGQGRGSTQDPDRVEFPSYRPISPRSRQVAEALKVLTPEQSAGGDAISNALRRFQSGQYADFQNEIRDFSRQYEERIGQLQDELTKYKGGLVDVNKAYGDYADDADAILKEAASLVADPLPDSAVVETVQTSYAEFGGALADVLSKIDANGNEALAAEMSEQINYMQGVIVDGLRSGLASQTNLHQLASAQAQALANMAWKDDLYNAEKARFETELQIQAQITAKQEQISAEQAAMSRAIADATAQFENEIPSPDRLWDLALSDYFREYGFNDAEALDLRDLWDFILSNPQAAENYETFKSDVMYEVNRTNLMRAGLWDEYEAGLNLMEQEDADVIIEMLGSLDITRLATSPMNPKIRDTIGLFFSKETLSDLGALKDKVSILDNGYASILDLWSLRKDFIRDYNSTPFIPPQTGSQASSNLANKNQPAYQYRRETAIPYFAKILQQRFPGVEFGGVHFTDKSRTTVSRGMNIDRSKSSNPNSDHVSGGAMDVYFKQGSANQSNQKLTEVAGWLRMQPWASLVVFEGNKAHQKLNSVNGHVHVSIQIGYQI